jgi:PPOX class probable F420-dependent enzyme
VATDDAETISIPQEVLDLFDGRLRIGYVSTARPDGNLSVVPVGVMLQDSKIRISSRTKTNKVRNLKANPHIAVCVTDPEDPRRYAMITGAAELADDVDRVFVDWLARTHMGHDEYPYEGRDVPRTVITIRPERFTMPVVHGSAR